MHRASSGPPFPSFHRQPLLLATLITPANPYSFEPISDCLLSVPCSCFAFTAEDSLNIALREVTVTARDGRVSQLDQVYIRGSMVRFFVVPDMLANAPM